MTKILFATIGLLFSGITLFAQIPPRVANTSLQMPPEMFSSVAYQLENAGFGDVGSPVAIASPPGDTRLFIADREGKIYVIPDLDNPVPEVFLDIGGRIESGSGEEGLLGLTFHPDYATNGYFYVFYTHTNADEFIVHDDTLARFSVSAADPNLGDASSEMIMIQQPGDRWGRNHNAGDIKFGTDGYLYVSLGDGGNHGNAQEIDDDFYSALMRIDVDGRPGNPVPNPHPSVVGTYWIPADNPFIGATEFDGEAVLPAEVRTEFFAVGLRNPWRFNIDPPTGMIVLGDVGEGSYEEVNVITSGGNYGWPYREGPDEETPPPAGTTLIDPINAYDRDGGLSVIGGIIYRGSRLPELNGRYLFTDWGNGEIRAVVPDGNNPVDYEVIATSFGFGPRAFGKDPRNGDVLIAYGNSVRRLVRNETGTTDTLPQMLSATGAFSDLTTLTPEAGILPYEINAPFWSDGAVKSRWFSLPDVSDAIGFDAPEPFTFPTGSTWIKHFDIEMTEGDPSSRRRLETRFIVKTEDEIYGVTYRWNSAQTDAVLVPEEGASEDLTRMIGGSPVVQRWEFPSRSSCLSCHTASGGWALGFDGPQLNRDASFGAEIHNQLSALDIMGYFETSPPEHRSLRALAPASETSISTEFRARSYLQANCAQCHDGSGVAAWDARLSTPLASAGIIDGILNDNGGDTANRVIAPGDPAHSMMLARMSTRGPTQMPPIGSHVVDAEGVALITAWINDLAGYQGYEAWSLATAGAALPKAADADGDGVNNIGEFLLDTDPLDPLQRWDGGSLDFQGAGGIPQITFDRIANRAYTVQFTDDLAGPWQFLDVPGNELRFGSTAGGVMLLDTSPPPTEGRRFYRLLLSEP